MPEAVSLSPWLYVVQTSVEPAVEGDWNRWYDEDHLPTMVGCPGWQWGERFVAEDDSERSYLTLYGLSGPDALQGPMFESSRGWGPFASQLRYHTKLYRRASRSR